MNSKAPSLFKKIRGAFRVQYRLAILFFNETSPTQVYCAKKKMLLKWAHGVEGKCCYWYLYKSGPFGLSEREVDYYMKGGTE